MDEASRITVWINEANRFSTIAEQGANRVHVTLSVGLAAISAVVAAAFVAKSSLVLGFAPVVAMLVVVIAAYGTLETLYASLYQAHAELRLRELDDARAESMRPYGRGPRQPARLADFSKWTWGVIVAVFVFLILADWLAAFLLLFVGSSEWTGQERPLTVFGLVVTALFVLVTASLVLRRFRRAWNEMLSFSKLHLGASASI